MVYGRERPLGLFEVLARNRQSALGPWVRIPRTQEKPHRVFTIPPRQRLSSLNRLAIRRWNFIHLINTHTKREKERKRQRERQKNIRLILLHTKKRDATKLLKNVFHFCLLFGTKIATFLFLKSNSNHFYINSSSWLKSQRLNSS